MSLSTTSELLHGLSETLDDASELEPMLQRFLVELRDRLEGIGCAILELGAKESPVPDGTPTVCMIPHDLPRAPCYSGFWEQWSPATLDAALAQLPDDRPLVAIDARCAIHAFRLPGFGVLILIRDAATGVLSSEQQQALVPLTHKLAKAAHGCRLAAEAQRQTQRLKLAADAAGIGIWEWDVDTGRLDGDPRTLRQFGIPADAFTGRLEDWIQRIHPEDQTQTLELINDALRGSEGFELEYRIVLPAGGIRHLRSQGRIIQGANGLASRIFGVNLDITPSSEAEEALRHARNLAESANLAKSRFIASLSHEIRTPLHGILGLTELALDSTLTAAQRDYLGTIRSSAESLLDILNDVFDFAKIEAGKLRIEEIPFNLAVMVAETLKSLATSARRKGLELVYDQSGELPGQSLGDPGRIRQVLAHLCDNAIQFTERGEIRVEVQALPGTGSHEDRIQFSVTDTGGGIPADRLQEIFNLFSEPDASIRRKYGGTGLGLSICARLIELMGGRIWAESQEGEGSRFHFTLPLPRLATAEAPLTPLAHWPGKRVLIVDDHPINRRTLACWFKDWGFATQEAGNGRQALELALASQTQGAAFDVYLLGAALPEIDGFALAERLCAAGLREQGRMIIISASGQRGDAQRCRDIGIDAFLTTPATPLELRETLTRILNHSEGSGDGPLLTRHHLIEHRPHLRILLVEDNEVSLKLASALLTERGHAVELASHGAAAVERVKSEAYDLIFMDLYMPVMDGIEATRIIRQNEQGARHTPIIAMTAHTLESDRERCLEAGMDAHIAKPLQPRILEELVERFATQPLRTGADRR